MRRFLIQAILGAAWGFCLLFSPLTVPVGCGTTTSSDGGGGGGAGGETGGLVVFTPVGSAFPNIDLIDLEFLPGQGGELIVIGQDGTVYYVTSGFSPLSDTESIDVLNSGEQGLLSVEADPDYDSNRFIYLYFTLPDGSANQVDRLTVNVDVEAGTFSLSDRRTILSFPKSDSPDPGDNHNGGGMAFDEDGNLTIGVGDGGGGASADTDAAIGQDTTTRLAKILRVVPSRTIGAGGFSIPTGGNGCSECTLPEIYSYGVRNPFTLAFGNGAIFIGDVGADAFEEIDLADTGGLNFGWPLSEGPTSDPGVEGPIHGYSHTDEAFINEDEDTTAALKVKRHNGVDHGDSDKSIMVGAFYTGSQYGELLSNRLIYSDFYHGFVRGLGLSDGNAVTDDDHFGHLTGMTSLQEGPDGFLYAVSLYGSDQILRLDLAP